MDITTHKGIWLDNIFTNEDGSTFILYAYRPTLRQYTQPLACYVMVRPFLDGFVILNIVEL